jgi:dihydroorotate dehydrogenase
MFATSFIRWSYRLVGKPVFFAQDPENVHDRVTGLGALLGRFSFTRHLTSAFLGYKHPSLEQTILGIRFKNPVGLAAGFDKDARLTKTLPGVGFGFEEIGSVTGEPCEGNPKPRLWRLPKSNGLIVNYGLKNEGSEAIAKKLRSMSFEFPIGTSVAKTNSPATVEMDAGIADYAKAFRAFTDIGDYFTINISCPNAYGGEPFVEPGKLDALLTFLDQIPTKKPIFLKLPADISFDEADALVSVADRHRVQGLIATNLTKKRENPAILPEEVRGIDVGGISGKPVANLSNELISHLYGTTNGRYVIIGCGGIFSAEDAYEKIRRGASLVQLITGMIYEGPQLIGELNRGLVRLLERDGFKNVAEAVGSAVK